MAGNCIGWVIKAISVVRRQQRASGLGLAAASSDLPRKVMSLKCVCRAHTHASLLLPFFPEGKWGTKILEHPDYLTSELLLKYTLTLLGHWMQVKIDSGRRIKRSSQTTVCEGLIYLNSNKLMSTYYVSGTGIDAREMKMKEIISFFNIYFIHYAITVVSIFPFSTLHLVPLSPPSNSLP